VNAHLQLCDVYLHLRCGTACRTRCWKPWRRLPCCIGWHQGGRAHPAIPMDRSDRIAKVAHLSAAELSCTGMPVHGLAR